MNIQINSCKLILELTDTETGEIITREATLGDFKEVTKKATTTRSKKPKDDGETTPMIHLLEGKWQMNHACMELTGFEPEQKLEIKFKKEGRKVTPILCEDEKNGNRLTKSFTVSCRGSKHDNLAEFGDTFEVIPCENEDGYFKLKGNIEKEDDIVDIPEEISDPEEEDLDMSSSDGGNEIDFNLDF